MQGKIYNCADDTEREEGVSIATKAAFENAMSLDVAMGGSTNTVLHILAAAQEGEVADFDLGVIDEISRNVPCLSKVSPNSDYHMEDVHRAGGIPAILGELRRAIASLIHIAQPLIDAREQRWAQHVAFLEEKARSR